MSVLEAHHLSKGFGGVQAVQDVSLAVDAGEMLALIGPNGAGKSTTFDMLGGQLRPDAGEVWVRGRPATGLRPGALWRLGVGRTFQVTATFASMTVRENVQMASMSAARDAARFWRPRFWRSAARLHRAEADALLDRVGLLEQAERAAGVLAYGDLKRLELALALAHDPALLLMDEPTAGMAPAARGALMALTRRLATERALAVLFTEHDMDVVFSVADRVLVLDRGRVIARGRPDAVRADAGVQRVYLGTPPAPGADAARSAAGTAPEAPPGTAG